MRTRWQIVLAGLSLVERQRFFARYVQAHAQKFARLAGLPPAQLTRAEALWLERCRPRRWHFERQLKRKV